MFQHIIIFIISILSIDLFNIAYKAYKKLWLKRINFAEKNKEVKEEELTTYEDVVDKKIPIIYGASAVLSSIYINFLYPNQMNQGFFGNLIINFEYVLLPLLIYITCSIVWGYIKGVFDFIKGVKQSFDIEEDDSDSDSNLDEDIIYAEETREDEGPKDEELVDDKQDVEENQDIE